MKRFTLIDIALAALIATSIGAMGLGACGCNLTGANKKSAETNAQNFAEELGLDYKKVSCNNLDSDGDGYVSCTMAMSDGSIEQFECAAWGLNSGCRRPKLIGQPLPAR